MVESIVTVVLEVAKCLGPPTERQLSYVRNYRSNFENLKTELEKLKDDGASMQHGVDEAKRKGEEIEKNAEKFTGDADKANKRCFMGLCPNLKTRHQLSKEAVRQFEAIVKLREAGRFDRISYRKALEDIRLISNKDYEAFESRISTLNNVLRALQDPDVNMVGIYGMGGIGKTTLAKEVAIQFKRDQLFDQVIFVEVPQIPDIRKIQGEIADKLGLIFFEETESGRARSLYNRLKDEKKILVILDNVWESVDLQDVGIPHGDNHKGCKILMTARSEDILSRKMDCRHNFSVGVLREDEAWSLFEKMAGEYIESSEFKGVATEVANECAGLPVSIVTVARALRNKRLFEWKDALGQLRRPSSTNFKDIQPAAYSAIELSYNKLEGEELKKIFLLIGYTYISSINDVLMYGMGLGLFQGINRMEEARARVYTLVYKLKASCMLLEHGSKNEHWFSMHDVVRDVAIAIATREQNVLTMRYELVNSREWLDEGALKFYTSIVLHDSKMNVLLPEVLECPQLQLLSLWTEKSSLITLPDNFFRKLTQVRVLDLTYMHLSLLPSSLGLLTNLRTLCLYCSELQDIAVIGELKNLEILCLRGSYIEQLPVEIGQLTRLRSLDLRDCDRLQVIPPNVLSNLSHLEELYIRSFNKWEVEVEAAGVKNASLEELKHLPNLTTLELCIPDVNTLPKGLFFEKLERYRICVGRWCWEDTSPTCSRTFRLLLGTDNCISFKSGHIVQLQRIEDLCLSGLPDQDIIELVNNKLGSYSSQLKHLWVEGCQAPSPKESKRCKESTSEMRSNEIILEDHVNVPNTFFLKGGLPNLETLELYNVNVERIWKSQLPAMSCGIQTLTRLIVYGCGELRCLFSSSIDNSFIRLQHLEIDECPILEEIIVIDQQERKNVVFPQLQFLKMVDLEKLTSFCTGDVHIEFPTLETLEVIRCPEFLLTAHDLTKEVFPNLKYLTIEGKKIPMAAEFPEDMFCKLNFLDVIFEESTTISSLDFLRRFHSIRELTIRGGGYVGGVKPSYGVENWTKAIIRNLHNCCDLKHILIQESKMDNLVHLTVEYCDHLINLVPPSTSFQNLTTLKVWRCKGLINVLTSSTAKSLVRLTEMSIVDCSMITEVVADDEGNAAKDEIVFSELMDLELCDLRRLTSFCSGNCAFKFPALTYLSVDKCPNMKIFSGKELSTPSLHEVEKRWLSGEYWTWKGDLNSTIQLIYLETKEVQNHKDDSGQPSVQHQE
ncbi:putative disease resistance protein [Citrus sinensis]|nr:putative disease resistance protein [Citrus sinensis]